MAGMEEKINGEQRIETEDGGRQKQKGRVSQTAGMKGY